MSVINQMLKDLDSRQNQLSTDSFWSSSAEFFPSDGASFFISRQKKLPILIFLSLITIMLLFWWEEETVLLTLGLTKQVNVVDNNLILPTDELVVDEASTHVSFRQDLTPITSVFYESNDSSVSLVFKSKADFSSLVSQRYINNAEVVFEFDGFKNSIELPKVDLSYLVAYGVENTAEGFELILKTAPNVSVEVLTETGGDMQGDFRFSISFQRVSEKNISAEQVIVNADSIAESDSNSDLDLGLYSDSGLIQSRDRTVGKQHKDFKVVVLETTEIQAENLYRAALSALQAGRERIAIEKLANVIELKPDSHDARELLATLYLRAGRISEADVLLEKGISINASYIPFTKLYARSLLERGDLQQAADILTTNIGLVMDDVDYLALLAATQQRLANHDIAIDAYIKALSIDKKNGNWWLGLAVSYEALGHVDDALQAYLTASSLPISRDLIEYINAKLQELGG